jgi:putative DNA primase/helicase
MWTTKNRAKYNRDCLRYPSDVGEDHEPRAFSTCCPTSIAAIGSLPGTIEDRSILIAMRRRRSDEPATRFRPDRVSQLHDLCRKAARWAADNAPVLRDSDPSVPSELHDRAADNWRPLFAIADQAGEQWPGRARAAALTQSGEGLPEEDSLTIMLLSDIRDVFAARKADRLPSEKLVEHLFGMQDRPWPTFNRGKGLRPARLARMLKPFGITPRTIRLDTGNTPKGYYLPAFEDAFARYLAVQTATTPHDIWRFKPPQRHMIEK